MCVDTYVKKIKAKYKIIVTENSNNKIELWETQLQQSLQPLMHIALFQTLYTPGQNLKTIWKNLKNHILRRNIVNILWEDVWKTKTNHGTKWQQHTKIFTALGAESW